MLGIQGGNGKQHNEQTVGNVSQNEGIDAFFFKVLHQKRRCNPDHCHTEHKTQSQGLLLLAGVQL